MNFRNRVLQSVNTVLITLISSICFMLSNESGKYMECCCTNPQSVM